jgi:hypothetical protein
MSYVSHLGISLLVFSACGGEGSSPARDDAGLRADSTPAGDANVSSDASDEKGLGVTCSGASPSFATDVTPILHRSCSGGEICHSGLSTNAWPYEELVNAPAANCASAGVRVTPSDLDKSYLIHKLTGVGMCPETMPMPRGRPRLPDAEIQTIADWICAGAHDN